MCPKSLGYGIVAYGMLFCWGGVTSAEGVQPLVVHEWGTFTALENEAGEQLLGINVDTEPVPAFVYNLGRYVLNDAVLSSKHWIHRQKGVPKHHPSVNLRLETPVIYFYPPPGMKLPHPVDVDVKFRGGWLTEYYPQADIHFPIVREGEFEFKDMSPMKVGHISWKQVQIGTTEPGPETNDHVWLAPRNVASANLTSERGEHEKYLFYRGVAQQIAPLKVRTTKQGDSLELSGNFPTAVVGDQSTVIQNLWLMETRVDGTSAYRRLEALSSFRKDGQRVEPVAISRRFADTDFDSANRGRLEMEMNKALLEEGLFADEAKALLSTWQQAYFLSPGLRVFYTVPRAWTDHFLPLTISGDPKITRVMIGRLELISDLQRELLDQLARTPTSNGDWLARIPHESVALKKLLSGRSDFGDLGVPIPKDFQMYLGLGRFRNALIAAEERRTRSKNLTLFIQQNELDPFRLSQGSGK